MRNSLMPVITRRRAFLMSGLTAFCSAAGGSTQHGRHITLTRIARGAELSLIEAGLAQAYGSLGWDLRFINVPGERALMMSNEGQADGETARVLGMEAAYPNLHRVECLLLYNKNSVFVYGSKKPVPQSLKELSALKSVGILAGRKSSEDLTAGWSNVVRLSHFESALTMLRMGRLDAILGRDEDVRGLISMHGLSMADFPSRLLTEVPLYHYLHRKHDRLIPAVASALNRLKGGHESLLESMKVQSARVSIFPLG